MNRVAATRAWPLLGLLLVAPALAADRHVLLDTNGDGFANPCPNPAHDDVLKADGVVACNGKATFDIDKDGTAEPIYCTPQACVWNMAKSDSCEVHAGVHARAGVIANEDTAGDGAPDQCDRSDCWQATVVAWGYGPNMKKDGYGTAAEPGWLRGAVMNGSTDTWDGDGDRIPDTENGEPASYPAIFDGNVDGDAELREPTSCAGNTCTGDAFYAVFVGCGHNTSFCDATPDPGQKRPQGDTDGDGVVDAPVTGGGPRSVAHFRIRDLAFRNYNGGAATCTDSSGVRDGLGHIMLGGGLVKPLGTGDGLKVQHIHWYDGAYTRLCVPEHYVAVFGDNENRGCRTPVEISDSFIVLQNRFVLNDDCDSTKPGASECGCSKDIHDNRIHVKGGGGKRPQALLRLKSVDTVNGGIAPKIIRVRNNEIIWETNDVGVSTPIWNECMGTCDPFAAGKGEFWYYGNLMRLAGAGRFKRFAQSFCANPGLRSFVFNNTFDLERQENAPSELDALPCSTTNAVMVSKNNVFWRATSVNIDAATRLSQKNDICSEAGQTSCPQAPDGTPARTEWWTKGAPELGIHASLLHYIPLAGGPLDEVAKNDACDPDDDGVAGVDYDGDGVNDTAWRDLAGNTVSCPTSGTPLDLGALQNSSDALR